MRTAVPTIEVLSLPGCPSAEETLRLAGEVVAAAIPGTEVRDVRLTAEAARDRGFPGSPTVLVNGLDIEGRVAHASGAA